MTAETGGSVTHWLGYLKQGNHAAAQPLWERYFDRLVRLARGKLAGDRRLNAYDEDVALSAFDSFFQAAAAGRFPKLNDRNDLWRSLFDVTVRKAINLRKHSARLKRGGGKVRDEAGLDGSGDAGGLDALFGDEPTPELAAIVAEECRNLLGILDREDPTLTLRRAALWKLEGYTNDEIAEKLGCARRTVANRLELIRALWVRVEER
jgi:DNA-directed RNA polymerase specialized sigma24 family protein